MVPQKRADTVLKFHRAVSYSPFQISEHPSYPNTCPFIHDKRSILTDKLISGGFFPPTLYFCLRNLKSPISLFSYFVKDQNCISTCKYQNYCRLTSLFLTKYIYYLYFIISTQFRRFESNSENLQDKRYNIKVALFTTF